LLHGRNQANKINQNIIYLFIPKIKYNVYAFADSMYPDEPIVHKTPHVSGGPNLYP
jgi:hypothetical protein